MRPVRHVVVAITTLAAGLVVTVSATVVARHNAPLASSNSVVAGKAAKAASPKPSPTAGLATQAPASQALPTRLPASQALPAAGNPRGHAVVPRAARAVNTSHPSHVVGSGTPASC